MLTRRKISRSLMAITAVASGMLGCGKPTSEPPVHVYIGIDVSPSVIGRRGAYLLMTEEIARELVPGRDSLTLYAVDRQARCLYDQPVEAGTEVLDATITSAYRQADASPAQKETFCSKFFAQVAKRAAEDPEKKKALIYFSDADEDGLGRASSAETHSAAGTLANNPTMKAVAFFSLNPENYERIHTQFGPLKNRLLTYNSKQTNIQPLVAAWH